MRQLDDTHVHWHAEIWGKDKEWDAEIIEQVPDQRIAWKQFKDFIENRGAETGGWRGEVRGGRRIG